MKEQSYQTIVIVSYASKVSINQMVSHVSLTWSAAWSFRSLLSSANDDLNTKFSLSVPLPPLLYFNLPWKGTLGHRLLQ